MKKLVMYFAVVALAGLLAVAFSACDKQDDIRPMVNITGNFTNTPNPAAGFNQVTMPDGSVMAFPKQYVVDGTCSIMGDIMEAQSVLESINPVFDPRFGFKGDVNITLVDSKGDKLFFKGEFLMFQDFSNQSFLRIDGGTGRYEDAQGWFNATGQFNSENGVNTITGAGKITEPNKK
jgi:hypothetical protein